LSDLTDKQLGMHRDITRRDFLNGVALTLGAAIVPSAFFLGCDRGESAPEQSPEYYPPALTGMRGSHPGSFEIAHSLRDGTFWQHAGKPVDTGEHYDLVIVGGGISGLSAAHFFRKIAGPNARVLILDNHDDFGGHAKRNEFSAGNRMLLSYGGTFSIESPRPYSAVSKALITELGIDVPSFHTYVDEEWYGSRDLHARIFFDKETFGADKVVINPVPLGVSETEALETLDTAAWKEFLAQAPLSPQAKRDFVRLHRDKKDYLPGLSSDQKKARLARMSYAKYLTDFVKVHDEIVRMYQTLPHAWFGVGIDAVSAQDAWSLKYPGFRGLNLAPGFGPGANYDTMWSRESEDYFFHFPDGNASIARLLVRALIPDAIPGSSAADVVMSRADYAKLDERNSPVRIRLNSTAVRVKHLGDPSSAKEVEIAYSRFGRTYTVRAARCILACWHVVIPYICDEFPGKQMQALHSAAKVPVLYTNVAIKNWTSFDKLKVGSVHSPGSYYGGFGLGLPVSIGGYKCTQNPEDAIVIDMSRYPCKPGLPARDQHVAGRTELFQTSFETLERNTRDQLARVLGPGGFDPARDITAITANRWPHGYAYEYNSLWDDFWLNGGELPCEVARQPFGRIAIANADAGAYAYTDCAIDQAWRAVGEITKKS
jgi:spermidine dehydrogenase